MAATNIFYRIPTHRGTRVASIAGTECTLDQFCNHIFDTEGLNRRDFMIASGTKVFRPSSCNLQSISLQNNSNVDILIPLLGGKGGFGSLLRAIGAQIEKTTNRDACRDLSGRRLRDIKREEELRKLIELRATLEEERKRKRKEKLQKLKKKSEISKTSASIQELVSIFDDNAFNQRRLGLSDIIDAAVEKGLINARKRQKTHEGSAKCKISRIESDTNEVSRTETKASGQNLEDNEVSSEANEKKANVKTRNDFEAVQDNSETRRLKPSAKKTDLWLGLEDENLDQDGDEEEEEEDTEAVVVIK